MPCPAQHGIQPTYVRVLVSSGVTRQPCRPAASGVQPSPARPEAAAAACGFVNRGEARNARVDRQRNRQQVAQCSSAGSAGCQNGVELS